tara:strand:+ start:193 stop:318 length:126 start_codon:yes stop_codon:yes gene_type:complete
MIPNQPLFPGNIRDAGSQMNVPDSQSDGFAEATTKRQWVML